MILSLSAVRYIAYLGGYGNSMDKERGFYAEEEKTEGE